MAPEFAKAATKLADEGSTLLLGKVDATEETDLAEKFEIRGYPTLKFFNNGKIVEYSGGRTSEDIIKWLKKKTGPPAVELTSADDAKAFQESQKVVVVAYFDSKESDNAKTYLGVASENDEIPFGIIYDKSVAEAVEISQQGVVLFKRFDENRVVLEDELTTDNLKKFVSSNSLPLVVEFSHEVCINLFSFLDKLTIFPQTAQKIFGGEIKTHNLLFISYKSDDYNTNLESYRNVAKDFKGKVLFVTINTDDEDHEKIMEFFGLKKEEVPALRLIKLEDEMTKFKPEKVDFSADAVRQFVSGVLEGTIKVVFIFITRSFILNYFNSFLL